VSTARDGQGRKDGSSQNGANVGNPTAGLGSSPVACGVAQVAWVADCSAMNPLGRVLVASKATTGHSAWERTSSAGQGAGHRYTALTDRLQQG
jgi:hypothetical protein